MVHDERKRHALYRKLEATIGKADADTMMAHLPPTGWSDVARKADLDALWTATTAKFDQIDARFDQIDGRLDQMDRRFDQIDGRFDQIDGRFDQYDDRFTRLEESIDLRLRAGLAGLESTILREMRRQLWAQMAFMLTAVLAVLSINQIG
jgi:hypothetical protein